MKRLRQIFGFMRPFMRPLILALVLTGVLTVIGMAPPLLMRRLLNDVARQGNWGLFPLVMTLLFAVPVLRALVNLGNAIALNTVGLGIIAKTRMRLFRHLMRLSMRFYNETPVGSITQRLLGDVGTVSGVVTGGLIGMVADIISVVFAVTVMLRLNVSLSLFTFGLLPLYFLNYKLFSKRIQENTKVLRTRMDHISSMLQERLSAHELIQAYGQDRAESVQFNSQAKQIMDAAIKGSAYSISFNHMSAFINKIGNTGIYCLGCYFFVKGSLGYGDVVAFCAYATQLLGPVVRFSAVANQIVQAGVSIDRINEILNRQPAIKETPEAESIQSLAGDIHVHGLSFQYGETPALRELEVEIKAGTHVAVVGSVGAGRSTLAMLLRRFYEPQEGRIEVDGKDIRHYRLKDYRASLALVLPESVVFDGTIRENLCYGKPDAGEERMIESAKAVGLHDIVQSLTKGYDTKLGTGGLVLSAGDKQRIGIARALISDPLILIADEATAVMDPESAEQINQAMSKAMTGRTCIFIVNRVLMAQGADHVLVMDEGQIVDEGRHDDLIRTADSPYRDLYGKQYGEDRLPPPIDPTGSPAS
jgi:ABC-type multidrug transport system fused ATPase/permease subunit